MHRIVRIILSLIFILTACANSTNMEIAEEEAKEIVINCHPSDVGEIDIVSVVTESDKYIVKWKNKPPKEGLDSN